MLSVCAPELSVCSPPTLFSRPALCNCCFSACVLHFPKNWKDSAWVNSEDEDRGGRGWVYWLRGQVTITVFYAVTGDKTGPCGVIWFLTINPEAVFHISHNKSPRKVLTLGSRCA